MPTARCGSVTRVTPVDDVDRRGLDPVLPARAFLTVAITEALTTLWFEHSAHRRGLLAGERVRHG